MDHSLENSSVVYFQYLEEHTQFSIMRTFMRSFSTQKEYILPIENYSIMNVEYTSSRTYTNSEVLYIIYYNIYIQTL